MRIRSSVFLATACSFVCFVCSAQAALDGVADSIQSAGDILFDGSAFLNVEGESVAAIVTDDAATGYLVVDNVNPIQTATEIPGDPPTAIVKGGLDVLPANTNASGGAALFDQRGGPASASTWEVQFSHPGTYFLYPHTTMYNGDANTNYGSEDSFYLPPAFNMNSRSDWVGFEGINWTGGEQWEGGGPAGPQTGDHDRDGWRPTFNNRNVQSAGVAENHNTTTEDFWDGQFHWDFAGFVIDINSDGGFVGDFGMAIQYEVAAEDVGQVLTFEISTREHLSAIDQFVFSTSSTLLQDFTQGQLDQLINGVTGDMDFDGDTDFDDINGFVLGLNDPTQYECDMGLPPVVNGDTDGDNDMDFDDISGFVDVLSGAQSAVPEPATWLLAGIGLLGLFGYRRFARS